MLKDIENLCCVYNKTTIKDTAMKRSLAKEPITTTSEIIADARAERAKMVTSSSVNKDAETPDFTSMTKKKLIYGQKKT